MKTNDLTHTPRERTSVFITGVDTSTPDDLVKDGMCEKLHNMRYEGSAWRPTHPYKTKNVLMDKIDAEFDIVYHHPAAGENTYIARYKDESDDYASITFYEDEQPTIAHIATIRKVVSISHFGNVLIFFTQQAISYAILDDGVYKPFVIPPHMATSATRTSTRSIQPSCYYISPTTQGVNGKWVSRDEISSDDQKNVTGSWFPIHNVSQGIPMAHGEDNHWHGDLLLFTTWRMKDGTNLSPSPLHLIKSYSGVNDRQACKNSVYTSPSPLEKWEKGADIYLALTKGAVGDAHDFNDFLSANLLCSSQNKVRISFPASTDTSAVHSIAVWCTRPYPVFSTDNITPNSGNPNSSTNFRQRNEQRTINASSYTSFYDNTNIADQPFYLFKEFELSEALTEGDDKYVEVLITSSLLDAAMHNTVYVPNNNTHSTISGVMLDYNMRLHSADTTTILCRPYDFVDVLTDGDSKDECYQWADVEIDNKLYTSVGASQRGAAFLPSSPYFNVISYPDYRAKRIGADYLGGFMLKEAPANNLAWYHAPHTEDEKYPPIEYTATRIAFHPNDNSSVHRANHIVVSAANNCFSFPFENSYAVGSSNNRILALQSAAIEMSDAKFGEMPLYAFTTEGIFALQAGAQTLYSNVIPINYDKIINPNTLAINGAIAYITEKGVHLLTNQGTQVISTPIHDKSNRPPLDFLKVCKMIYPKEHNEIVLLNKNSPTGVAYVYNLEAGYWSTRDLNGIKLNTDELYYDKTLYDLANEDESKSLPVEIVTRPIKLGDVEFKRLETIIPRMATTTEEVLMNMSVDGSVDGKYYRPLRQIQAFDIAADSVNPLILRRTPFSAKYFKCKMQLNVAPNETTFNASITHIDFEWYRKLRHRMR